MKNLILTFTLVSFLFCYKQQLLSQNIYETPLIVNEIGLMPITNAKYVELLVVGDLNAPGNPVNLEDWIIDNNTTNFSEDSVFIRLGNCFSELSPGTVILIYNDLIPAHGIISARNGLPNNNGIYQVPISDPCLVKYVFDESYENSFTNIYSVSNWADIIPLKNNNDAFQIRNPEGELIMAIDWSIDPYSELNLNTERTIRVHFNQATATLETKVNCGVISTVPNIIHSSPGWPNSEENDDFINSIDLGFAGNSLQINCSASSPSINLDGNIVVTITGGTPNYDLEWSGPSNGSDVVTEPGDQMIENLAAGQYKITVTDDDECTKSCEVLVSSQEEEASCDSDCTTIGEENPNQDYCYHWEPEQYFSDPNISLQEVCPEVPMTFTLTVVDDNGEIVEVNEYVIDVQNLDVSISPEEPAICDGYTVELEALIWNENNDFDFSWSSGETTQTITVDQPGTYSVTVTDPALGCTDQASVNVSGDNISVTIESNTTEVCVGAPIQLDAVPGNSGNTYSFEWSNAETSSSIVVEEEGTYSVTIVDLTSNCEASAEITLSSNDIEVSISPSSPIICPGGELTLTVPANYTYYSWSTSEEGSSLNSIVVTSTGEYSITVTDINGCTATNNVQVNDASDPAAIKAFFESKGFYSIPIVIDETTIVPPVSENRSASSTLCDVDDCAGDVTACVQDDAGLGIIVEGINIADISTSIQTNLSYFNTEFSYTKSKAYITSNDNVCACTDYLEIVESKFDGAELGYWVHLFKGNTSSEDELFILANVPSVVTHYPGGDEKRENYLSSTLDIVYNDPSNGNFSSKAEQILFVLQDLLLDNHVGLSPFVNDENTPSGYVCENNIAYGANIVAPSGVPMKLPDEAIMQFGMTDYWKSYLPEGSLTGFTEWINGGSSAKYYKARPTKAGDYFKGYYQISIRGTYLNESPYLSPVITSTPAYLRIGNRETGNDGLDYYDIDNAEYTCTLPSVETNGEGAVVPNFDNCLGDIQDDTQYNIDLPPISEAEFGSELENAIPWEGGILVKITREGGYQDYIYGTPDLNTPGPPHEYIYYRWNCITGEWEPFDPDPSDDVLLVDQINHEYTSEENKKEEEQEEVDLSAPSCFALSAQEIGDFYFNMSNANPTDPYISDHVGLDNDHKEMISDAVNTAYNRWSMRMKVILSGDAQPNGDVPTEPPSSAYDDFYEQDMTNLDVLYWVHYRNNGTASFCIRFSDDYFDHEVLGIDPILMPEKLKLKEVLLDNIRNIKSATVQSLSDLTPITDDDDPMTGSQNNPWYFGIRKAPEGEGDDYYTKEVNFFGVTKEIIGIGRATIKALEIPELVWKEGKDCMFDTPGAVMGPGNAIIGENPIVGIVQGVSLACSISWDEVIKDGIVENLKNIGKLVRGIVQEKYNAYTGSEGVEVMTYHAGYDGTTVVIWIVSGGVITKVTVYLKDLGKNPKTISKILDKDIEKAPNNLSAEIYLEFDDLNLVEAEDFIEFLKGMGANHYGKLMKNKELVKVWKKYHGNPNFDLKNLFKKFPEDNIDFYNNFLETFFDFNSGTLIAKTEDFLVDLTNVGDDLLTTFKDFPGTIKAWKAISPDDLLRKNSDKLKKVDDYADDFGKNFDEIADEFDNVPASQRSGWVDHLEYRTNGIYVNKAADRADAYGSFTDNDLVPEKYSSNSEFNNLATDPAQGGVVTPKTRQEAMAGLEAESQGLIAGPIIRDQTGADFIDGNGGYWDVKGPHGNFFNLELVGESIKDELEQTVHKVLLDCTWIDTQQLQSLREWLQNSGLSQANLDKIIEVNSNLF